MIKRLAIPIFVARYVFLVLLEELDNKDKKPKFPNKPLTKNKHNGISPKNTEQAKVIFSCKKPLVYPCLTWLNLAKSGDRHNDMCSHLTHFPSL